MILINPKKKIFEEEDLETFNKLSLKEKLLSNDIYNFEYLKWKFTKNPKGKSLYYYLEHNEEIVGRLVSAKFSSRVYVGKKFQELYFLSDLLIQKTYRSPINNLINLYKICLQNTNGLILQSSNKQSEKFYEKVLQKKSSFYLTSYGLPISSRALSKNLIIKILFNFFIYFYLHLLKLFFKFFSTHTIKIEHSNEINITNNDIDELKQVHIEQNNIFIDRDFEFLNWRVKNLKKKNIFKLYDINRKITGYVICIEKKILNMRNFIILDYFFKKDLDFTSKVFFKLEILKKALSRECDNIFTMGNIKSKLFSNLSGFPFFKIPDFLLPHKTPVYFHNADSDVNEKLKKINISPADLDYF